MDYDLSQTSNRNFFLFELSLYLFTDFIKVHCRAHGFYCLWVVVQVFVVLPLYFISVFKPSLFFILRLSSFLLCLHSFRVLLTMYVSIFFPFPIASIPLTPSQSAPPHYYPTDMFSICQAQSFLLAYGELSLLYRSHQYLHRPVNPERSKQMVLYYELLMNVFMPMGVNVFNRFNSLLDWLPL